MRAQSIARINPQDSVLCVPCYALHAECYRDALCDQIHALASRLRRSLLSTRKPKISHTTLRKPYCRRSRIEFCTSVCFGTGILAVDRCDQQYSLVITCGAAETINLMLLRDMSAVTAKTHHMRCRFLTLDALPLSLIHTIRD